MTQKRAVTPTLSERCALKPPSKSNHAARMRQGYENCEFLPLRGVIHALCTDHHAGKCYNQGPWCAGRRARRCEPARCPNDCNLPLYPRPLHVRA